MAKVYSSEFGETAGWVLVNDFTIHESKRLKDRPFMLTRVPKSLHVDLQGVRAAEGVEWAGDRWIGELKVDEEGNLIADGPEGERDSGYNLTRYIYGRATFNDKITVFTIDSGASHQFQSIDSVRIAPLPRGKVGGKHKATTSDGIGFSGMSSHEVPASGLMEGEPGRLWLDDGKHEPAEKPATLNAELYLDEDQFNAIFEAIRDGIGSIGMVRMKIAAELFEGEVQASLSEWWMPREYGMIEKGNWARTRARIDTLHIAFGRLTEEAALTDESDTRAGRESDRQRVTPPMPNALEQGASTETQKLLRVLIKRSGWLLATLVALLIVTMIK